MGRCDMAALRRSVDLESRADLMAAACNFGEASALMREANRIRRQQFGSFDPNALRDFTATALDGCVPLTEEMERSMRDLTTDTIIDRDSDRIEGDVGL